MKVAYNNCSGGFSLSNLAMTEYAKKKGFNLTWYKQVKHEFRDGVDLYERIEADSCSSIFVYSLKRDMGEKIESIPCEEVFYESFFTDESRTDPDLIEIIERLGDDANGSCAKLAIEEIPNGAEFEIDEYGGTESVVHPRKHG